MNRMHWQDMAIGVLGLWLAVSPWVLDFSSQGTATMGAVILGVAVMAAAVASLIMARPWEEWVAVALGLVAMAFPWVLGLSNQVRERNAMLLTGVAIIVFAGWMLATRSDWEPSSKT